MRAIVPSLEFLGLPRMRPVLVRAYSGPSRPEWVCMVPERRSCARHLLISKPAMRKNTHEQSRNLGSGPWYGSGGCPERPSCNGSSFYYNWNRRVLCDDGLLKTEHQGIERYRRAIGALIFFSTRTSPDIAAAVGILAHKSHCPSSGDWIDIKRFMRYLKSTRTSGLNFIWRPDLQLPLIESFADADWAGDETDRKSTSGTVIMVNDTPLVWKSKKQVGVSLSSTEAEFVSISECLKSTKWVHTILEEMNMLAQGPTTFYEDNVGAIKWSLG